MASVKWKPLVFILLWAAYAPSSSISLTDPRDAETLRSLYTSLKSPHLEGWTAEGGDPCGDQWQGVLCVFSNVTHLMLKGLNLRGTLGDSLDFPSILLIDLSDNHIEGTIPSPLPHTLTNLSLSNNGLSGEIPDAFQMLTTLQRLDLSDNQLTGSVPPSIGNLFSLNLLDLSSNRLSNPLPSSMANMQSLNSLYMQNNKLTGLLNVLQDLSLLNLNIENNFFSGPIPQELFYIPNFRKDGNPFNTTVIPSPPPPPMAVPPSVPPPSFPPPSLSSPSTAPPPFDFPLPPPILETPNMTSVPSISWDSDTKPGHGHGFVLNKMVLMVVFVAIAALGMLSLCFLLSNTCCKRRYSEKDPEMPNEVKMMKPKMDKVPEAPRAEVRDRYSLSNIALEISQAGPGKLLNKLSTSSEQMNDYKNARELDKRNLPSVPPRNIPSKAAVNQSNRNLKPTSLKAFTIASLQQYTRGFSGDNFLGEGIIGSVYRAKLPSGRLIAVKKLKRGPSMKDQEFDQLLSTVSRIHHDNILQIEGYCNDIDNGQRLLVYGYCKNGSLHDALQLNEAIHKKLTWNARMKIALGAAKALQYLHEACMPPIMHKNFRSVNILLDDKLAPRISEAGLPQITPNLEGTPIQAVTGVQGYCAPEVELGIHTCKSDIYSFGVVLLELLTGRKPYDRSRSKGAQSLVRWAVPRLHDAEALSRIVDPPIRGSCPVKSLSRFADIISRCIQWEVELRPQASEVVQDLLNVV